MFRLLPILVFVFCVTNAEYFYFNEAQNCIICELAKNMYLIPKIFRLIALRACSDFVGMISKLPDAAVQLIVNQISHCPIDPSTPITLSQSFEYHFIYPDGNKEILSGFDYMTRCLNPNLTNKPFKEVIFIYHGFIVDCPATKGLPIAVNYAHENAEILAKKRNALIIIPLWGPFGLSSCNYMAIVHCYLKYITDWNAHRIVDGVKSGFFPSTDKIHHIGHSLGAHFIGYIAEEVNKKLGKKLGILVGLDPAGPCFANNFTAGRRPGISKWIAEYTIVFNTDAGRFGTSKTDVAHVNILSNSYENFFQNGGLTFDFVFHHNYATQLFHLAINGAPLFARFPCHSNFEFKNITIFNDIRMADGTYCLEANDNEAMLDIDRYY